MMSMHENHQHQAANDECKTLTSNAFSLNQESIHQLSDTQLSISVGGYTGMTIVQANFVAVAVAAGTGPTI